MYLLSFNFFFVVMFNIFYCIFIINLVAQFYSMIIYSHCILTALFAHD